jgi:hypothetical protein
MRAQHHIFGRVRALVLVTAGALVFGSLGVAKAQFRETNRQNNRQTDRFAAFDALDRNGDGRISLDEFLDQGSRREFESLDLNGDGYLTPREFSRRQGDRANGASGESIIVNSAERWTDTGISVDAGDTLMINAVGRIQMSDNPDDIATPAGARSGRLAANAPLKADPAGMLIARIGNSEPIAIGEHRTMRAPRGGEIYLGVNDDHLPDNRGDYRVTINVQPR